MTHEEKIATIKSLVKSAEKSNRIITVEFVKKDGTTRVMTCHRAKALERTVAATPDAATVKRKATLAAQNMLCVEELVRDAGAAQPSHQFRTINMETVSRISAGGQTYRF